MIALHDPRRVMVTMTTRGRPLWDALRRAQRACEHEPRSQFTVSVSAYGPHIARNDAVARMLASHHCDGQPFTHLLFVDDDVTIPCDAVTQLLELDQPVTTGCVPTFNNMVGYLCPVVTVGMSTDIDQASTWYKNWFDDVRETAYCGGACVMIRRDVFETIGFPWFRWPEIWDGQSYMTRSDDVDFCERVKNAGFNIFAHGRVRCGHVRDFDIASIIPSTSLGVRESEWGGPKTVEEQDALIRLAAYSNSRTTT